MSLFKAPAVRRKENVKKDSLIKGKLNPLLKKLGELNGKSMKHNLRSMGIPTEGKKVVTKQLSGYISRVKQEIEKEKKQCLLKKTSNE